MGLAIRLNSESCVVSTFNFRLSTFTGYFDERRSNGCMMLFLTYHGTNDTNDANAFEKKQLVSKHHVIHRTINGVSCFMDLYVITNCRPAKQAVSLLKYCMPPLKPQAASLPRCEDGSLPEELTTALQLCKAPRQAFSPV